MHELGLARAIAGAIRENGWQRTPLEVRVTGSHAAPDDFDRALLAHLAADGDDIDPTLITVTHGARTLLCSRCAVPFGAAGDDDRCPSCGGAPLPAAEGETVEIIVLDGGGSRCA